MVNILYNLNSVEQSYGEATLTTVVQIDERINGMVEYVMHHNNDLNDFEKDELAFRVDKLISLNRQIAAELEKQAETLRNMKKNLAVRTTVL
jgi:hypothetical protein